MVKWPGDKWDSRVVERKIFQKDVGQNRYCLIKDGEEERQKVEIHLEYVICVGSLENA